MHKLLTDCNIGDSDIDNFLVFFGKKIRKNQLRTDPITYKIIRYTYYACTPAYTHVIPKEHTTAFAQQICLPYHSLEHETGI